MALRAASIKAALRPASRGRVAALAFAIVLAGVLTPLKFKDTDLIGLPQLLLVVPVALFALSAGVRGGIVGSLVLFALNAAWHTHDETPLDWAGDALELAAYLIVGVVIGWSVDRLRKAAARLEEHERLSLAI